MVLDFMYHDVAWEASQCRYCHRCSCEGRIYGALFNLMCILKGSNRRINFKLSSSSLNKRLGVTDVHNKAKLRRTSKGGQSEAETTTFPHVLSSPAVFSEPSQWSLTGAANIVNKTLCNWPLLRVWGEKKLHLHINFQQNNYVFQNYLWLSAITRRTFEGLCLNSENYSIICNVSSC